MGQERPLHRVRFTLLHEPAQESGKLRVITSQSFAEKFGARELLEKFVRTISPRRSPESFGIDSVVEDLRDGTLTDTNQPLSGATTTRLKIEALPKLPLLISIYENTVSSDSEWQTHAENNPPGAKSHLDAIAAVRKHLIERGIVFKEENIATK
ncbi:hypothetical protein HZC09_01125 [Candidatus Micrarchaeota archaeon]|nr:hypothetical protein [Candidatus Micrarchaeota archaeon]